MKILIVEDSLALVNVYSNIIRDLVGNDVEFIAVVNYNEYCYFKHVHFDLAIFDWNIGGGTSRDIIEESISDINASLFITGYAKNEEVLMLSDKYDIPILSKPTSEFEVLDILERVIVGINEMDKINKTLVSK
jgi:hypothetical protein|tara:strand:+ start:36214 stop:36612 length:399 start_codon:yes stop_codon:yes gene_type:complete